MNATIWNAIGWTLIHSLWEGLLIGAIAFGCASWTRTPERRYWVYCAGMAGLLVALVVTFFALTNSSTPSLVQSQVGAVVRENTSLVIGQLQSAGERDSGSVNWNTAVEAIAWLWAAGVLAMSFRALAAALGVRRLRRSAKESGNLDWQRKVREWSGELGITRAVRLCVTALNDVPAVIGHFKPIILLPAAVITRLSGEQVETLILHELMHVRRNDFLANALQVICETLLFFHPVAWGLSGAIREEREHCCDEAVARFAGRRVEYAKALVSLEELRGMTGGLLPVGAGGGSLKKRVARLLAPEMPRTNAAGWVGSLCAMLLLAAVIGFSWPKVHAQTGADGKRPFFQLRMAASKGEAGEDLPVAEKRLGLATMRLSKDIIIETKHVVSAQVEVDPISKQSQVMVTLNEEGAKRFADATEKNIGKQAAIVVDGKIISAPVIRMRIQGGKLAISGNFTEEEAASLARKLSGGAKPDAKPKTVEVHSHFLVMDGDPARRFALGKLLKEGTWTLTADEARKVLAAAKEMEGVDVLAAPAVTTLSGRWARISIEDEVSEGQSLEILPEAVGDVVRLRGSATDAQALAREGRKVLEQRFAGEIEADIPRGNALAVTFSSANASGKNMLLVLIPAIKD